jgi:RNA polymerase sigma-70 factor (ECF subfamily)
VDATTPQPGDLTLPLPGLDSVASTTESSVPSATIPPTLLNELCREAQADRCGLSLSDFHQVLSTVGRKLNYNLPPSTHPTDAQRESFYRALQLADLALAHACALGREAAWQQFVERFRAPLNQAASAITRSASLGHDLAESLYSELYGLSERDGCRLSPLASYSGRGSLMGWLRTTLAQRHVDHHRRVRREEPIEDRDFAAASPAVEPETNTLPTLSHSLASILQQLPPEDRFLLSSYFLDQRTLQQIAKILHVHEATISRKLKRLTASLHQQLLAHLQASGLSRRAAEESLGVDPRDLPINLRPLLQTSAASTFSKQEEETGPHPS